MHSKSGSLLHTVAWTAVSAAVAFTLMVSVIQLITMPYGGGLWPWTA